ncbi:F-box protein [Parasponia andersonii]|uniref:F-box protein n=1 Tax=Parasponia andersonii TaxID=3476 RepID=A0A2P5DIR8_PARAD|nr:F-box protein [Parasponia andersonii]
MDADWAGFLKHLLDLVFEKMELEQITDCLGFDSGGLSWHHVAMENRSKLIKLNRHQYFLHIYDRPIGGSSEGWLATLGKNYAVTLYKPFMENRGGIAIHLPPLFPPIDVLEENDEYLEYYIFKFTIFTPDPIANSNDLVIVVIFGVSRQLAYIRPNKDITWTGVLGNVPGKIAFDDVLYYKDQFYTLTYVRGQLASFNITDSFESNLKAVTGKIPKDPEEKLFCCKKYLVESYGGELLQVQRYREFNVDHVTRKLRVFKLCFDRSRWIEIKDIGEKALFLGDNTSVSVKTSNFVECQKNCIYFTDDKDTTGFGIRVP